MGRLPGWLAPRWAQRLTEITAVPTRAPGTEHGSQTSHLVRMTHPGGDRPPPAPSGVKEGKHVMLARHRQSLILQAVRSDGGAVLPGSPASHEPGFDAKLVLERPEKTSIARAAASMVTPGTAIAIGSGTTTFALAQCLLDVPGLTIVTNSLRVTNLSSGTRGRDGTAYSVVLTGGVRPPSDALVGPVADLTIRSLHFDLLFLGCYGFDVNAGLTTPNLAEAETNRTLIRVARRVVVLADHTKWGLVGLSSFARLSEVDVLITDDMLPADARNQVEEQAGEVVYADGMVS